MTLCEENGTLTWPPLHLILNGTKKGSRFHVQQILLGIITRREHDLGHDTV